MPPATPRVDALVLALFGAASALLGGACGEVEERCPNLSRTFELEAVDSLGNARNIDAAYATREGERVDCTVQGRPYSKASCDVNAEAWTLVYFVDGVEQEYALPEHTSHCNPLGTRNVRLLFDGPGCDFAATTAVQGSLRDEQGEVPVGTEVSVRAGDAGAECEVDAGSYQCPALSPVANDYRVFASFPGTGFSQEVQVTPGDCGVEEPAQADFALDTWVCEVEPTLAGQVYVRFRDARSGELRNTLADSVTVKSKSTEPEECPLAEAGGAPGPRAYLCPTKTRFGSGTYTFTATRGEAIVAHEQIVPSFNCVARTATVMLDFEE